MTPNTFNTVSTFVPNSIVDNDGLAMVRGIQNHLHAASLKMHIDSASGPNMMTATITYIGPVSCQEIMKCGEHYSINARLIGTWFQLHCTDPELIQAARELGFPTLADGSVGPLASNEEKT